ncbi:MAG: monovalent cation/H(+) antiporter subunit G, partial [Proteobacteria bacterium]|nr:monovalent cation/H(+) antiporter subunit G [Pseudomonadota bacterium]
MMVVLDWIRLGLSAAFVLTGGLLMLGAAIGLLRFPDVFTRLHAGCVTMSAGVCLC